MAQMEIKVAKCHDMPIDLLPHIKPYMAYINVSLHATQNEAAFHKTTPSGSLNPR
ncbi:hypothetical protein D8B26_007295 [Coccidioides posadasii str. Silveira]|uniref:Predicted protein n=1 Tax=Coccidioides posadasii (strain RMSCC 757 / Silveira) TaxID=443226 RepID=E9D3D1_COCPS|nr:predicted protein [Coccidioides posadasii str. Silveira]QVM12678.1 hypothetical protein D8B26_007295 [Coccidioides posadasii str. Silveira]